VSSVLRSAEVTHFDHVIMWHDIQGEHWSTVGIDRLSSNLEHNPIEPDNVGILVITLAVATAK
jgi:hypothetical protein